jgi:hypothetical protein
MRKLHHLTGALVVLSLAAGIATATAAETGTKTMPDSSIYPPRPHHRPVYNFALQRHECYLPSGRCNNQHRMQN